MKIALAQINYHVGNFSANTQAMIQAINRAKQAQVRMVIFSELSICGYPPQDLLNHKHFVNMCNEAVQTVANHCDTVAAIIGAPIRNPEHQGKSLFNAALFLYQKKIYGCHHKTLLSVNDILDEYRYFTSNNRFSLINFDGEKIAISIGGELWDEPSAGISSGCNKLYSNPIEELMNLNPTLLVNIAALPFSYIRVNTKKNVFIEKVRKYAIPLVYVNQVGGNTELLFDGNSFVVNGKGQIVNEMKSFEEDFLIINTENIDTMPMVAQSAVEETAAIHDALVMGIRDFFYKLGFHKAIVGLSGGIDSAITLVLAAEALGPENLRAILMPSPYSSEHSVHDAIELAKKLNVKYDIMAINEIMQSYYNVLAVPFAGIPEDVTEENIQARIRGNLLMAFSNKMGYILLNTSNKSEVAVGYGTLYGDMAGSLSVLGDLYKTQIYKLAAFINRKEIIIPQHIIIKEPSAELRPGQKDSDSLPPYDVLDKILFYYIEKQLSPEEITAKGFDVQLVKNIISLVHCNEYKRYQSPPVLRISTTAFGMRRMPLVAKY